MSGRRGGGGGGGGVGHAPPHNNHHGQHHHHHAGPPPPSSSSGGGGPPSVNVNVNAPPPGGPGGPGGPGAGGPPHHKSNGAAAGGAAFPPPGGRPPGPHYAQGPANSYAVNVAASGNQPPIVSIGAPQPGQQQQQQQPQQGQIPYQQFQPPPQQGGPQQQQQQPGGPRPYHGGQGGGYRGNHPLPQQQQQQPGGQPPPRMPAPNQPQQPPPQQGGAAGGGGQHIRQFQPAQAAAAAAAAAATPQMYPGGNVYTLQVNPNLQPLITIHNPPGAAGGMVRPPFQPRGAQGMHGQPTPYFNAAAAPPGQHQPQSFVYQQHGAAAAAINYPAMGPHGSYPFMNMPPPQIQQIQQHAQQQAQQQQQLMAAAAGGAGGRPQPTQTPPNIPGQQQQPPPQQQQIAAQQPGQQPQQVMAQQVPSVMGQPPTSVAASVPPQGQQPAPLMGQPAGAPGAPGAPHVMGPPPPHAAGAAPHIPGAHPGVAAPAPGPQHHVQKRRSNAIAIINPETGKSIMEDNEEKKSSADKDSKSKENKDAKSSSSSPPSGAAAAKGDQTVAQEFAAKVAAAVSGSKAADSSSPATSESASKMHSEAPAPAPAAAAVNSSDASAKKPESKKEEPDAPKPIHTEQKPETAKKAATPEASKPKKEATPPAAAAAPVTPTEPAAKKPAQEISPSQLPPTPESSTDGSPTSEGKAKGAAAAATAAAAAASTSASKKKTGGAARKAELNRKGNEKAGSDMDVFTSEAAVKKADEAAKQAPPSAFTPPSSSSAGESSPSSEEAPKPPTSLATTTTTAAPVSTPTSEKPTPAPVASSEKPPMAPNHTDAAKKPPPTPSEPAKPALIEPEAEAKKASTPEENDVDSNNVDDKDAEAAEEDDGPKLKLKYAYKEDQWSPINQEGKKQYDRDFLMQLQKDPLSMAKPMNLPNMEIIKDKATADRSKFSGGMSKTTDWMPTYVKPTMSKGSGPTKRGSQNPRENGGRGGPPGGGPGGPGGRDLGGGKKIITGLSIQEDVKLNKAENAWKPGKFGEETSKEEDPLTELARKAMAILNKLTPQKFEKLVKNFNELSIDSEEKLHLCMEKIFEKAVDEPGFSVAYAKMCEVLQRKQVLTESGTPVNFRKLLITRCQKEFEKDYMDGLDVEEHKRELAAATTADAKKEIKLLFEEKERQLRRRSLGNMRFIGELYKLKMLTARIMHECVKKLLKAADEESLECLGRLLTTVGKDLEAETRAKIAENQRSGLCSFDVYFKAMEDLITGKKTSSRIRFMLQDLIDLRRDNWKPRREAQGPKTIDQIHKEAETEKKQQQLNDLLAKGGGPVDRRGDRDGRGGGPGGRDDRKRSQRGGPGGGGQQTGEDGWTVMPQRQARPTYEKIDPNRLKNMGKQVDVDALQLGPGSRGASFSAWGKGSSGSRASQTKEDGPTTPNRFAAFAAGAGGGGSGGPPEPAENYDAFGGRRSMGGVPAGRSSRGTSAEQKRAISAVMTMSGGKPAANGPAASLPPPGPPPSMAVPPPNLLANAPPAASAFPMGKEAERLQAGLLKGAPNLDRDAVDALTKPLLEEFLHNCDEREAVQCISEKFHPTTVSRFVGCCVDDVLERSEKARRTVATLFDKLIRQALLLPAQYEEAIGEILEIAQDLAVDIPKVWDYFSDIIAPLIAHGTLPLNFLLHSSDRYLKQQDPSYPGKLASAVLHNLSKDVGHVKVGDMWRAAQLSWDSFMASGDVQSFVKDNKLEFTLGSPSSSNGPMKKLSQESVSKELQRLLSLGSKNNDEIMDWVDSNLGKSIKDASFIRTLVENVANSAIVGASGNTCELKPETLRDRIRLLKRFIDGDLDREKQTLYALQHLMHKLEHPNKLLHQIFEILYDTDVLTFEAFEAWEKCDDPAEQEGKGVAIKSTTQFFTWLREADDDDDNES